IAAPFRFNKWSHVPTCPMLRFQRSPIFMYHQRNNIPDKMVIPYYFCIRVKRLGNHKMDVAILSVAEDDSIGVLILLKQILQIQYRISQLIDGKSDIFKDHRSTAGAHSTNRGK